MPVKQATIPAIRFKTQLYIIGSWTILRLPQAASAKLPSRALAMVEGTINGHAFRAALEPDGKWSHWCRLDTATLARIKAKPGDIVDVEIAPTKEWLEPAVPADVRQALAGDAKARALWDDITPGARWDWIRWIRAVKTPETRAKHITVALSKLNKGMRRPCCFNRNACSEPAVSHNWVLLEPGQTVRSTVGR